MRCNIKKNTMNAESCTHLKGMERKGKRERAKLSIFFVVDIKNDI